MRRVAKRVIGSIFRAQPKPYRRITTSMPINSTLFIEHLSNCGNVVTERVEAKKLRVVDRRLYIYGWCEMVPGYRGIPIESIIVVADGQTGDIVPRADVADWLLNRATH